MLLAIDPGSTCFDVEFSWLSVSLPLLHKSFRSSTFVKDVSDRVFDRITGSGWAKLKFAIF